MKNKDQMKSKDKNKIDIEIYPFLMYNNLKKLYMTNQIEINILWAYIDYKGRKYIIILNNFSELQKLIKDTN